jgi:hypothetical protein
MDSIRDYERAGDREKESEKDNHELGPTEFLP